MKVMKTPVAASLGLLRGMTGVTVTLTRDLAGNCHRTTVHKIEMIYTRGSASN